ncbi:MAG: hypothetical protein DMF56_06585 [Acidobacteria bacterium]|nr:MAG: hypothetical protein DMF56_06585 [Acidobacteriota bacterium]
MFSLLFLVSLAAVAGADVYFVTSPNDSGPGTLRQAILDANAHPGLDQIDFSVATTDRVLINFLSPLVITSPLILDGATQAVGRPEPPVILDRFTGTGDGLVLDSGADGSEIRNLEIRSVSGSDFAAIRILGASGVHVSANVLGSNAGSLSMNEVGIVVSTSGNLIGGFSPSDRNIIGGNGTGVLINNGAFDNTVAGNYFGVDSSGTVRLPNVNAGISIENGSNNTIGGSNDAARNVITSSLSGIVVSKPSRDNHIERNYVGTTPEGLANPDLRNVQGIVVGGVGDNVVVKNLVSNNGTGIVVVEGFNQLIQGNIIGTNPEITRAVPNGIGISILNITDVADLRVGGAIAGEGNRICGNTNEGILVDSTSVIHIEGNIIGVNALGDAAIPNGTGVRMIATENTILGGPIASAGNLISGNRGDGVIANRGVITSNRIGVVSNNLGGLMPLPNGGNGVGGVSDGALVIGEENAGNVIANNGGWGIDIGGNATVAARAIQFNSITNNVRGGIRLRDNSRETIRRNSIGRNGGLGIDLAGDGVTLNDSGDGDTGANARQNFPVLSSFTSTSSQLSIRGTLNSTPNTTFTIDVYSSLEADPTTFGEGETWLTSLTTRTDAGGNASFTAVVPAEGNTLKFITATATDPAGNTSEFSKAFFTGPSGPPKHRAVRH